MTWKVVQAAFKGLSVGVILLLCSAVLKLKKAVPNNWLSAGLFLFTLIGMLTYNVLVNVINFKIPSITIIFIVLGLLVGIIVTLLSRKEASK